MLKSSHKLPRIVIIALCLVGAYVAVGFAFHRINSPSTATPMKSLRFSEPDYVKTFPSPDGSYHAKLLTWAGGGAISPYCNEAAEVIPTSADVGHAYLDTRYKVYSGECDTFADHSSSPDISWKHDGLLRISFSINNTFLATKKVELKKSDMTRGVKIEFESHE